MFLQAGQSLLTYQDLCKNHLVFIIDLTKMFHIEVLEMLHIWSRLTESSMH